VSWGALKFQLAAVSASALRSSTVRRGHLESDHSQEMLSRTSRFVYGQGLHISSTRQACLERPNANK
jgi:hypothetical protein